MFPISTERLNIRPFRREDFENYQSYHQKIEVYKYLYCAVPDETTMLHRFEGSLAPALLEEGDLLRLALERQNEPGVIGQLSLRLTSKPARQAELGFILNPDFGGVGYASEAVHRILDIGFTDFGLHRVFARIDSENLPSIRLVERLIFRREAHFIESDFFEGKWGDEYVYSLLSHEWRLIQGSR